MAKIEYKAECLCGGRLETTFKKPTRFEPTIKRAICSGCSSEFLFTYSVEYNGGMRAYVPEHKVLRMTAKLKNALNEKHGRPKAGDMIIESEKQQ